MRKPLLILFFLGITSLFSQNPQWIVYDTTNSELPNNDIWSIAIDIIGNKWIGTGKGLVKFDGINWTVYDTLNSELPDDNVLKIAVDIDSSIWIVTSEDLSKFDGIHWTNYNITNTDLSTLNDIMSIKIDKLGNKWMGTFEGGLIKFDGINWFLYNLFVSNIYNSISNIDLDNYGNIWMTYSEHLFSGGGLSKYDGINWTNYYHKNSSLSNDAFYAITIDDSDNKWLGTFSHGLVKFDGTNWNIFNKNNSGIPDNNIMTIIIDSNDNKWIGTYNGGLVKFDGMNWTVYNKNNSGLPDNSITSIVIDKTENKWIGTEKGGLAVFNENGVQLGIVDEKLTIDDEQLTIYPNPAGEQAVVSWQSAVKSKVNIKVYDVMGREMQLTINNGQLTMGNEGKHTISFDARDLKSGVYFVKVETDSGTKVGKLVVSLKS